MDIKDEASIINSDENVVSDVEQADLSINGDDSYTIYPNAEVRWKRLNIVLCICIHFA